MGAKTAIDLLPAVRRYVLQQAALGYKSVALGQVTLAVEPPSIRGNVQAHGTRGRRIYRHPWSQQLRTSKLGHRGWVQTCLSRLAKEHLLWERQRPEVVCHDRADKYFRLRITQAEAIKRLAKQNA